MKEKEEVTMVINLNFYDSSFLEIERALLSH
jgi:hypothetical protein